jgi:hypothetical protein
MTLKPPKEWRAQGELQFEEKPAAEDGQEPIDEHLQGDALATHKARTGAVASAVAMGGTPGRQRGKQQIADPA